MTNEQLWINGMKPAQKPKHSVNKLPLSTTNPTQTGLELSLGPCGDTLTTI